MFLNSNWETSNTPLEVKLVLLCCPILDIRGIVGLVLTKGTVNSKMAAINEKQINKGILLPDDRRADAPAITPEIIASACKTNLISIVILYT